MRLTILPGAMALATHVLAAPLTQTTTNEASFADDPNGYMMGFKNPSVQSSVGGRATCISGIIEVTASATNIHINTEQPANQSAVTELLAEKLQVNSTLDKQLTGGETHVSGTYNIYSQLCFPNGVINATTVQFLVHGAGLDRSYWNIAPGYSYVDYAADQGYTTFLYDRLGIGLSDRPDSIQTVQTGLQVEITHQLIQMLRSGGISNHSFEHVVGVGHSYGSFLTLGVTAKYPKDCDAVVLTGFSPDNSGMPVAFSGLNLAIASEVQPHRLSGLSNGYLTSKAITGTQFFFFRAPGFDPALLNLADATKQTISLGEYFTLNPVVAANFTGPIDVVNGEFDMPNCYGNCRLPINKAAAVKDVLYPAASNGSSWYLAEGAGHGLNLHYSAPKAYEHIQNFIKSNGF